jgi:hypothetical protein
MFDPAAMGTLIIGLNAAREERPNRHRRRSITAVRRHVPGVRVALARGLRRAAEMLERPTLGEAADA